MLAIIWGNQKWNGAAPILIIRAKIKRYAVKLNDKIEKGFHKIEKEDNRINEDPRACTRKYFEAASTSRFLSLWRINGINDRRLISKPIQI